MSFYTIGIKRKWFWGYDKYRVVNHKVDFAAQREFKRPKFCLTLPSGAELTLPDYEGLQTILYPDYDDFILQQAVDRQAKADKKAEAIAILDAPPTPVDVEESADLESLIKLRDEIRIQKQDLINDALSVGHPL